MDRERHVIPSDRVSHPIVALFVLGLDKRGGVEDEGRESIAAEPEDIEDLGGWRDSGCGATASVE